METSNLNSLKKMALIAGVVASAFFISCKEDNDMPTPTANSIVDVVVGNDDFSLLEAAVVHANLVETLSGAGPFTVFAPNNAAFVAAGLTSEAEIKALPAETVKSILLYHVIGQQIASSGITSEDNTSVKTVNNADIFVSRKAAGVFVNGASVTTADIMADNGVIHVINTVLMPPTGNIVETAQANPNFTYLVAAVVRASAGSTNVAEVLSGSGPFTVFAPTNQAFISAGFPTIESIQAANPATLTKILTYHVIAGRVLSSDLVEGATPSTVNGGTVTITLAGGAKVKGLNNPGASTIAPANLIANNGVIHVIDQVLLPNN
jgi:uncharacterized surface protein with fasciclin (FAS1) repeats